MTNVLPFRPREMDPRPASRPRRYAELAATTNFSFLEGASHPGEMVLEAHNLGLHAIGIADRNTVAGVVRGWIAARDHDVQCRYLAGSRLVFSDGSPKVICYPTDREAWGRLTRLLTLGKNRVEKGACDLRWNDLLAQAEGQALIAVPPASLDSSFEKRLAALAADFPGRVWLAASRSYAARDLKRLHALDALARRTGAPTVATGEALYHAPERRPLQDVLTCIREKRTIADAGWRLEANAERHLKSPDEIARLFARWPDALERTIEVADAVRFDLGDLKYHYPKEPVPPGRTALDWLAELTWRGAEWRYGGAVPDRVRATIEKELAFIATSPHDLPHYFLTVHDLVQYARNQRILCQGRGSAANSAVCYCLGVTAVDPDKHDVLFDRFLSTSRNEPPDIDVDFEHERREEVMQYVYRRYGRDRAAIVATVIHYRPRSAIRDVGKALGLTEDVTARIADTVWGSWGDGVPEAYVHQAGFDPDAPEIRRCVDLANQLCRFPRHLSQHVGGFVLSERRLDEIVPLGPAAMEDRTFLEWDKDDIDALHLMKVDVLALGMLTALKRSFDFLEKDKGFPCPDVASIPSEAPAVYRMLSKADSVGVFQVESRAQMSMLPRLKPREFYDLVIEVAIVRPGPIQGDMVHPYLRRREGKDPVEFPSPSPEHGPPDELRQVLEKTLGVPLFQEQAMRLAIVAAGFTGDEANGLRRAMATFKHLGDVGVYREKFVGGMVRRGYDPEFAARCFKQIEGFGSYGFPESHAASFANLVYASAWVKCFHPDVFCAALLNSQPMGFYQPAQLVRDAREHGVEVRPVDVFRSDRDCTLEPADGRYMAVRLGLRMVSGLSKEDSSRVVELRDAGARTPDDFANGGVTARGLELLAQADAVRSTRHPLPRRKPGPRTASEPFEPVLLGPGVRREDGKTEQKGDWSRRSALWSVKGAQKTADAPLLALMGAAPEPEVALPAVPAAAEVAEDYRTVSLSLRAHPVSFFREALERRGCVTAATLNRHVRDGRRVAFAGLVLIRQRPGTAKGVTFLTLEDETGSANVVVWKDLFDAERATVMTAAFLRVEGKIQRAGEVVHLVAERFENLSPHLRRLREETRRDGPAARPVVQNSLQKSRDFH
jgi:error-prone DNA polymerase